MRNNQFSSSKLPPFAKLAETTPKYLVHPPNSKSPFSKSLSFQEGKQGISPRRTLGTSRSKSQKFRLNQKLESMSSPDTHSSNLNQLLDTLETDDFSKINWSTIFDSDQHCRIYPGVFPDNLSLAENKLFKRTYTTICQTEPTPLSLATQLKDSFESISHRTRYTKSDTYGKDDIEYIRSRLDVLFTTLHETVREISSNSKPLGLLSDFLHGEILSICRRLLRTIEFSSEIPEEIERTEFKPRIIETNDSKQISDSYLESELDRIKRENISLTEQLDKQNYEIFSLKSQLNQTTAKITNLLTVNQSLRDAITEKEHQQFTQEHKNTTYEFDKTLATVPRDVYSIWNDISQFSKFILDGNLLKFDIEQILPQDLIKNPNSINPPQFDFIKNLERNDDPIHFTTFFSNMKQYFSNYNSEPLFRALEGKFNEFVRAVFNVSKKRANEEIERNKSLMKKVYTEVENATSTVIDRSVWIRSLVSTNMLITTPAKDQTYDIIANISKVTANTNKLMKTLIKPRFTSSIINETFTEEETIVFLSNIMKYSKSDMLVDLFRKFILIELPFHAFLFFSNFWNSLKNISPQDHKSQVALLPQKLKNSGYTNLSNRTDLEKTYCTSKEATCAFAVALYLKLIDKSQESLSLETSNLKDEMKRVFDVNDDDVNDSWEFVKAVAVDTMHPTKCDLAIFGFTKRAYPSDSLQDFDPEQSPLCEYILNFGKSPKKQKKAK